MTPTKAPMTSSTVDPAQQLFTKVDAATATATSAHVVVSVFSIDQRTGDTVDVSGTGSETFVRGKTVTLSWSLKTGKQQGRIIVADGALYVRSTHPASSARPWVEVDLTAKRLDPSVRDLVLGFENLVVIGSPTYVSGLRPAASDVRARLPVSVHGVRTTDYAMYVDPTKVRFGRQVIAQLTQPVAMTADVALDDAGRVAGVHQQQNDGPTSFESRSTYTDVNAKVVIKAPSANQVSR